MDARRLLLLRQVLASGSMSAAARALGSTQPAVSQQLAVLEREAGVPLVVRSTAGVRPTEAGTALLRRAEAVAAELHHADEEMLAFSRLRRGVVRLASFPSAAATLAPRAAAAMQRHAPDVDVVLLEAEPPEAVAMIRSGDADVALVFDYGDEHLEGLQRTTLGEEPIDLVVPTGHPAAGGTTIRALADDVWIAGCTRCRQHLLRTCGDHGFTPRIAHTTDDFVVVQNLVAAGLGVAALPRGALTAYRHGQVAVQPGALGSRRIDLVHTPHADAVPATGALLAELAAAF